MFLRERVKNTIKKSIKRYRRYQGFNDLLSYLLLDDACTVLHKDGAISRHFFFRPPDLESSSSEALDFHAATWREALSFLGNGWMVETNVLSQPLPPITSIQAFPDRVSALIDDERRWQYGNHHYFKSTYYLSLTWKPDIKLKSALKRFAWNSAEHGSLLDTHDRMKPFNTAVEQVVGYLSKAVDIAPLQGDELTTFLYQAITGSDQRLCQPYLGAFLDGYLSNEDFMAGYQPKIGSRYIKVLAIDDVPPASHPCLLNVLSCFPLSYRWSSRFLPLDRTTANAYLKRYARSWSSKAIGLWGVLRESMGMPAKLNQAAQRTVEELEIAQTENSYGETGYGFFNLTVILMHEDLDHLCAVTQEMVNRIQRLDFHVREELLNATEAYLGSLPSHGDYNLRKLFMNTHFVSHALPTSRLYQGESNCPCKLYGKNLPPLMMVSTTGHRPFLFNLHVEDVGHTCILGPTGKGKTTLNAMIMASHRKYADSRIVVLDKDYSNQMMIKALGGAYFDISAGDCQFSPLARVSSDEPYSIDQAVQWLTGCCDIQGIALTPQQLKCLHEAVTRLAQEPQQYKNLNYLSLQDPDIREALAVFNRGSYRELLAGTDQNFIHKDVIGFEMGSLMVSQTRQQDLNMAVIKAILNELECLFKDKRPTLLILEEAWLYLRHDLFQRQLADWFKTLRKFNVAVIFISQDLEDITHSEIASVIKSSCPTKIYLPNESAQQLQASYQAFGLNDHQIDMIQKAVPKQDYYYTSPLGQRLFQLDLQALAQAFVCVSTKQDTDTFHQLYQHDDDRWVLKWLEYKNCHQWAEFAKTHYFQEVEHAS